MRLSPISTSSRSIAPGTILRLPLSGRLNRANKTREFAIPGLPYLIIYRPVGDVVDVIAIFHTSRDPDTKRQP